MEGCIIGILTFFTEVVTKNIINAFAELIKFMGIFIELLIKVADDLLKMLNK